jgi:hypothetical protein
MAWLDRPAEVLLAAAILACPARRSGATARLRRVAAACGADPGRQFLPLARTRRLT